MKSNKKTAKKKTTVKLVVPRMRATGRGSYSVKSETTQKKPGMVNRMARAAGEALGSAIPMIPGIGKLIPAPLVSAASSALGDAGSWLARAFGFGRYSVRKNSLLTGSSNVERQPYVASPPSFGSDKKGSDVMFSHREYIGDVKSSVGFNATTYPINPGNPVMFPWMSRIAELYEEYEMLGLIFEYRSTSATAVGTTSSGMGVVIMATDYDCYDSNFNSKRQMEAAEFSSAAVPYETFLHPVECDKSRNVMSREYVVPGITSFTQASGDARMSVLGNFTIATEGQQVDGTTIGELWCTYHLRLSRPVLELTRSPTTGYTFIARSPLSANLTPVPVTTSVQNGLPLTVSWNGGTGGASRIAVSNSAARLRGKYQLVAVTQYFTDPADLEIAPSDSSTNFGGGAVAANWFSYATVGSMSRSFNPVSGVYAFQYTTDFEFKSDTDFFDIPVLGAVVANGLWNCMITPFAQSNAVSTVESACQTYRERRLNNSLPSVSNSSSSSFDSHREGDRNCCAAAAALPRPLRQEPLPATPSPDYETVTPGAVTVLSSSTAPVRGVVTRSNAR